MKKIQIRYYALLREQAKRSEESLKTQATTAAELYTELQSRYGFTLPASQLKVAINAEFCDWYVVLNEGDQVVFIPPVAGG
jgi:molybdopterin converting factor subunit 1